MQPTRLEVVKQLMELPILMYEKEMAILKLTKEINEMKWMKEYIYTIVLKDVKNCVSESNEMMFKTKISQEEETRKRLFKAEDYKRINKERSEKKDILDKSVIDYNLLKHSHRSYCSLTRISGGISIGE